MSIFHFNELIEQFTGQAEDKVHYISIEQIVPNPYQPRRIFDRTSIDELCLSIRQYGILQPLLVRKTEEGYEFVILLLPGIIFYSIIYARYRNKEARHTYETETKNKVSNMQQNDSLIELRTKLSNSRIIGQNNNSIDNVYKKGNNIKK